MLYGDMLKDGIERNKWGSLRRCLEYLDVLVGLRRIWIQFQLMRGEPSLFLKFYLPHLQLFHYFGVTCLLFHRFHIITL